MEAAINRPEVEVVRIALLIIFTKEAVMLCCKHNKAVITTKPLGRNGAEAKRMLEAVEKAGVFSGYLEDLCYTPKFLKAMDSVRAGALGRILSAKSRETILVDTATGFGISNRQEEDVSLTWDAIAWRSQEITLAKT